MVWKGIVTASALLAPCWLTPSAYPRSLSAAPDTMDIIGVKLGMSTDEVEAALKAYNPATRIREIRESTPSGERVVRIVDAVVGGTEAGLSAQQNIIIFTLQPPARAFEIVRGVTFATAQQITPDQHLSKIRAKFGEPSRPGDFAGAIGIPGASTYAWVYDRHGNKVDTDTREGRDLYLLCGDHGFFADPGSYTSATQIAGGRETNVSDLMRIAVFYDPSCGVSFREQFIVNPENRVSHLFQDLLSDEMALADQAWVQQETLRARERMQEDISHLAQDLIREQKALADQGGIREEEQRAREQAPQVEGMDSTHPTPTTATTSAPAARNVPPAGTSLPQQELAAAPAQPTQPIPSPPSDRPAGQHDETAMQLATQLDLAIRRQLTAAAAGDAGAALDLANMYDQGKAVPRDPAAALAWYRRAAALGSSLAMFQIGLMHDTGRGIPEDHVAAARWYERAAALENGQAEYHLALLYTRGEGVPRDPARADELFRAAASHGIAVRLPTAPLAGSAKPAPATSALAPTAAVSATPERAKSSPTQPASSTAAEPAARSVVQPIDSRCGEVLMSEQLSDEVTYADRLHLRQCQVAP